MIDPSAARPRNLLLARMEPGDFALLAPDLEPFDAKRGIVLSRPDEPVRHAIFLDDGVASVVAVSPEGLKVEAGLFGFEAFAPSALAMDDDRTPFEANIQLPGTGHRIATPALQAALRRSPSLLLLLQRSAYLLAVQASYTALSNAVHPIEERLARWILMCDDRMASGEFALTHEFMSIMLAVRRPSVTTALHVLEGNGFVRATRGLVTVRNRAALEEFAGDAYGRPEREYERLLGPMR